MRAQKFLSTLGNTLRWYMSSGLLTGIYTVFRDAI
jgi:hypothetical protein